MHMKTPYTYNVWQLMFAQRPKYLRDIRKGPFSIGSLGEDYFGHESRIENHIFEMVIYFPNPKFEKKKKTTLCFMINTLFLKVSYYCCYHCYCYYYEAVAIWGILYIHISLSLFQYDLSNLVFCLSLFWCWSLLCGFDALAKRFKDERWRRHFCCLKFGLYIHIHTRIYIYIYIYSGFSFVYVKTNRLRTDPDHYPYENIGFGAIIVFFHTQT